jgi:cytochrome c peroxidase
MRRLALAEFQIGLTAANAPLDRFARGERDAMTRAQKRGAVLFFGKAKCVGCHAVAGFANEMFSDFEPHRIGGPQVAPAFGVGTGNVIFDGPGEDEDFGFMQTEGDPALRYTFRTAPLRNLKLAPGLFHNGAFGSLEAAIRHHLDVERSLRGYDPVANRLPDDLRAGPYQGILEAGIDPRLRKRVRLSKKQLRDLVEFVRDGLFDERVLSFCDEIPASVPSGLPLQEFEGCD